MPVPYVIGWGLVNPEKPWDVGLTHAPDYLDEAAEGLKKGLQPFFVGPDTIPRKEG